MGRGQERKNWWGLGVGGEECVSGCRRDWLERRGKCLCCAARIVELRATIEQGPAGPVRAERVQQRKKLEMWGWGGERCLSWFRPDSLE